MGTSQRQTPRWLRAGRKEQASRGTGAPGAEPSARRLQHPCSGQKGAAAAWGSWLAAAGAAFLTLLFVSQFSVRLSVPSYSPSVGKAKSEGLAVPSTHYCHWENDCFFPFWSHLEVRGKCVTLGRCLSLSSLMAWKRKTSKSSKRLSTIHTCYILDNVTLY